MCCFTFWRKSHHFFPLYLCTQSERSDGGIYYFVLSKLWNLPTCLCWDFRKFRKVYILRNNMSQYEEIYYWLFILFRVWVVLLNTMQNFIFAVQNFDRHHEIETCNLTQCFECIFLVLYIRLGCFYSSIWFRSSPEDLVFGIHRIHQLISSQVWDAACNWNHSSYLSRPLSLSVYIFSGMISNFYILPYTLIKNITHQHFALIYFHS